MLADLEDAVETACAELEAAYTKLDDGTVLYGAYSSIYSAKTKVAVGVKFTESSSTDPSPSASSRRYCL